MLRDWDHFESSDCIFRISPFLYQAVIQTLSQLDTILKRKIFPEWALGVHWIFQLYELDWLFKKLETW